MASEFFSDITSTVLSKTLDAASARQRSIAGNIANVETPGYKRCYVSFEEELGRIMESTRGHGRRQALKTIQPLCKTDEVSPGRPDGNNVNIDKEIADLAETSLKYRATTTLLNGKIDMLRSAITEGKR